LVVLSYKWWQNRKFYKWEKRANIKKMSDLTTQQKADGVEEWLILK